jgi:uncharacterized protein (DUF1697 family)
VAAYVAFLRGINLGNRRVKMADLARLFEEMEFGAVSTFIASGNVLFESNSIDQVALEHQIESHLESALGYGVDTFVRTRAEVAAVVAFRPFMAGEMEDPANTIHVGFRKAPLDGEAGRRLEVVRTETDQFRAEGRQFYWLCRIRTSESTAWDLPDVRAARLPTATMRNLKMLRRLVG